MGLSRHTSFWDEPDPELRDAGTSGELDVARLRLVIIGVLFGVPVSYRLVAPLPVEGRVSLGVLAVAFVAALGLLAVVHSGAARRYIGFVSALVDVTCVSGALALLALLDRPVAATNSQYAFAVYFLALGATGLRYDPRICLAAGLAAIAQYGGLVALIAQPWSSSGAGLVDADYGRFSWHAQLGRLFLLGAATYLNLVVVKRAGDLRSRSVRDGLTGLVNRGFFEERLREELAAARRRRDVVVVAMLDLDGFKRINDEHGHAAGDAALTQVAAALKGVLRSSDVLARHGGDEFALMLPGMSLSVARDRMELVRRSIEELAGPFGRLSASLTVSVGVASWPADGSAVAELVTVADRRLYHAKRRGRNCVVSDEESLELGRLVPAAGLSSPRAQEG